MKALLRRLRLASVDLLTDAALFFVEAANTQRDPLLALRLHRLADRFDKRPTGEWE